MNLFTDANFSITISCPSERAFYEFFSDLLKGNPLMLLKLCLYLMLYEPLVRATEKHQLLAHLKIDS